MKKLTICSLLALFLFTATNAYTASYQKAVMLNDHGLINEAKSELIDVLFSNANNTEKAKSYHLLGLIAFSENRIHVALDSWQVLVQKYPKTKEAELVQDRIKELAEIVGEIGKESISNAVAQSYIRHGDFWSSNKDYKFIIDSSWIPDVEVALKWYDKTIAEFPKTAASRIAYEEKMRTLLGWEDPGRYGEKHGIKDNFYKYMPQLLETFQAYEKEYPDSLSLQAFRYQIAQAYWRNKTWSKTREWLNIIIEKAGESDSFYKDTAQRRLQKIEY